MDKNQVPKIREFSLSSSLSTIIELPWLFSYKYFMKKLTGLYNTAYDELLFLKSEACDEPLNFS